MVTWCFLRAFAHFYCVFLGFDGRDDFSDVFCHGTCPLGDFFDFALLGNNSRQRWPDFFAVVVVCFVGVGDGAGNFGG